MSPDHLDREIARLKRNGQMIRAGVNPDASPDALLALAVGARVALILAVLALVLALAS